MRPRAVKDNPEYPPGKDEMFPLHRSPPAWPKRQRRREGSVKLEYVVGTDGRPKDIEVVKATARAFAEEAVRALKKWRFCPAFKDGAPVEADAKLTLDFAHR
ncbi:MAG: energy transducer TonB [Alphaproteobacteria bacterium]